MAWDDPLPEEVEYRNWLAQQQALPGHQQSPYMQLVTNNPNWEASTRDIIASIPRSEFTNPTDPYKQALDNIYSNFTLPNTAEGIYGAYFGDRGSDVLWRALGAEDYYAKTQPHSTNLPGARNLAKYLSENPAALQGLSGRDSLVAALSAQGDAERAANSGGVFGLPKITGNPFKDAKAVFKQDQANVGAAVQTAQPFMEHAIRNNPATMITGIDRQAAKNLGWDWLEHMTTKADQTFNRTSDKAAGFQEVFERQLAERMQAGQPMHKAINDARLEADRAHVRTNNAQTIQEGINRGEYRVTQGGDVVDRYGNTVLGQGLAQRGTTALQIASIAFPALAPIAAAAQTATAYRHGAPAGKAVAQGLGSYYAGQLGGQFGAQQGFGLGGGVAGGANAVRLAGIGSAIGSGAARGLTSGYTQGLRGGELAESAALGGLSGGLGSWAGGYGSNPFMSGLLSGGARGVVSGYRQGDIGQGIQQGLLSGGLSGAGNMAAQQYGQWARPIPQFAYRQLMQRG